MSNQKNILVLARRDHLEAMRVAAGLTIFGHQVRLVFMAHPVTEEIGTSEQAELLELSGIEPETTLAEMEGVLPLLDSAGLGAAIGQAEQVVNL
jgi:hypothetical protein